MKRIDNATATGQNQFTEGSPTTATPATIVDASWLNVLQEELAHVVEQAGLTLDQSGVDTTQLYNAIQSLVPNTDVPKGLVSFIAASTVPAGWLECNGAAISRTTYADLFSAIGTVFGAGDGSTTFNLPDTRGEFIRGWDNGLGVDSGRSFGSKQTDELKSHNHSLSMFTFNVGASSIPCFSPQNNSQGSSSVSTNSVGGSETRPRNIAMMGIIKF